jgi:hypothetical protein
MGRMVGDCEVSATSSRDLEAVNCTGSFNMIVATPQFVLSFCCGTENVVGVED